MKTSIILCWFVGGFLSGIAYACLYFTRQSLVGAIVSAGIGVLACLCAIVMEIVDLRKD